VAFRALGVASSQLFQNLTNTFVIFFYENFQTFKHNT